MTSHLPHHDPDTCRLIDRARAEGAERVLRDVEALAEDLCPSPGTHTKCRVHTAVRALIATHRPAPETTTALPEPSDLPTRPWCHDCGPGYRLGDEGCRHDDYRPTEGETGICRTCAQPIWWETGEVGHRERVDWSDRIKRGGDSIVCFKAVGYRHVPMGAREAAIYGAGRRAVEQQVMELADEWDALSKGETVTTRRLRRALLEGARS